MSDTTAPFSFSATAPVRADRRSRAMAAWLWTLAAMVFLMVFLGGATRLTESGLSITEWKPVTGVIPPLSSAAWADAFDKYKQIPQYSKLFPDMTLGHFQAIFLMEWLHRLVGRLLGAALIVPMIVFWFRGQLSRRLKWQSLGIVALGGLQGFVGWWMVSSGLTGRVEVAQERLAIHLLLASVTFACLVWLAAAQAPVRRRERTPAPLRTYALLLLALVFVQIGFGALVAGLRAGMIYNTWPLMDGHIVPSSAVLATLDPWWRNLLDNAATVQFQHRMMAYALFALALGHAVWMRRALPGTGASRRATAIAGLITLQATLGIVTLLLYVPIPVGLLHQLFAMIVLAMVVVHNQRLGAGARAAA